MFNDETKRASLWEEIQRHNCISVGNRDELVRLPTARAIQPDQKQDTVTTGNTLLVRRVCVRVLGGLRERQVSPFWLPGVKRLTCLVPGSADCVKARIGGSTREIGARPAASELVQTACSLPWRRDKSTGGGQAVEHLVSIGFGTDPPRRYNA